MDDFGGVLIFVIFIGNLEVTKISTYKNMTAAIAHACTHARKIGGVTRIEAGAKLAETNQIAKLLLESRTS